MARGPLLTEGDDCAANRSLAAHVPDRLLRVHRRVDLVNYRLQNSIVHVVRQSVQVHLAEVGTAQVQFQAQQPAKGPLHVDQQL